jgi:hypothetical protein
MAQGHHPLDPPNGGLPPIRYLYALSLTYTPDEDDETIPLSDLESRFGACFKAHRQTTLLLLKPARNKRRLTYGKSLLRMFIDQPKVTLQYILRTATEDNNFQPLSTNL